MNLIVAGAPLADLLVPAPRVSCSGRVPPAEYGILMTSNFPCKPDQAMKLLTPIFILAFVPACAQGTTEAPVSEASPAAVVAARQDRAAPPIPVWGHYAFGHEVESFQPCGSGLAYWVVGSSDVLDLLHSEHAARVDEPYEPVYAALRAVSQPPASDGFAADYDGLIRVTEVVDVRTRSTQDCRGQEPSVPTAAPVQEQHPIDRQTEVCMESERVDICFDRATRAWDGEMNRQWGILLGRLDGDGAERMRASQRAWITHRDAEFAAIDAIFGTMAGSIAGMIVGDNYASVVRRRALALGEINAEWT
jgi:uncharacterized protein YecT (DUF1311 family)